MKKNSRCEIHFSLFRNVEVLYWAFFGGFDLRSSGGPSWEKWENRWWSRCEILSFVDKEKIENPFQAAENQFPHQVTYRIAADNSLFCGGFIINQRWTGTSVRCINFRNLHFSNFIAVIGSNRLSGGIVFRIARVVDHPDYRVTFFCNLTVFGNFMTFDSTARRIFNLRKWHFACATRQQHRLLQCSSAHFHCFAIHRWRSKRDYCRFWISNYPGTNFLWKSSIRGQNDNYQ